MPAILLLGVVDDNIGYLLRRYAEKCGFRIRRANRPEFVVHLAHDAAPVAIILEAVGLESWSRDLIRRLRADLITCEIPILLYLSLMDTEVTSTEHVDALLHHPLLYEDFVFSMQAIGLLPPQSDPDRPSPQGGDADCEEPSSSL